jgi:hypothetical protein
VCFPPKSMPNGAVTGPWAGRFSSRTWANFLKRTQWRHYKALEAPGQAACLVATAIALPHSRPLELPQARGDTLTWPL